MTRIIITRHKLYNLIIMGTLLATILLSVFTYAVTIHNVVEEEWNDAGSVVEMLSSFFEGNDVDQVVSEFTETVWKSEAGRKPSRLFVASAVKSHHIGKLYLYTPSDGQYTYIMTVPSADKESVIPVSMLFSGCIKDIGDMELFEEDSPKQPVYIQNIDSINLKYWKKITDINNKTHYFCAEVEIEAQVRKTIMMAVCCIPVFLIILSLFNILICRFLRKHIFTPMTEFTQDMDHYCSTGELVKRQYYGDFVTVARECFEELAEKNCRYDIQNIKNARIQEADRIWNGEKEKMEKALAPEGLQGDSGNMDISILRRTDIPFQGDLGDYFSISDKKAGFMACHVAEDNENVYLLHAMKQLLWQGLMFEDSVEAAAAQISVRLRHMMEEPCVPAFFGWVDLETCTVEYVSAGYSVPFVYRKGSGVSLLAAETGDPLGIGENYRSGKIKLERSDYLFICSQAVTEETQNGKTFGKDAVQSSLSRLRPGHSAEEITNAVMADCIRFVDGEDKLTRSKFMMVLLGNKYTEDDDSLVIPAKTEQVMEACRFAEGKMKENGISGECFSRMSACVRDLAELCIRHIDPKGKDLEIRHFYDGTEVSFVMTGRFLKDFLDPEEADIQAKRLIDFIERSGMRITQKRDLETTEICLAEKL